MFIRIKRRKLRRNDGTALDAVLVQSVWEHGKPRQKVVRYLAGIQDRYLTAPAHRQLFWSRIDAHFSALQLDAETCARLEARLVRDIARPSQEELAMLQQQRDVLEHFGMSGTGSREQASS